MSNFTEEEIDIFLLQRPSNGDSANIDGDVPAAKKKRNLPGNPDPTAEIIALSPRTLMATNRFVCEVCNKGFQRDQNLQLHRRGHNLPWKLKQRASTDIRTRVYVCPEPTCVHHEPSRALGDLTGIKKHYYRKHGEKKWKCERCSKRYAVQSDWKAHVKICGTREYQCDCGTIFSRKDSFITHRAFCDALAEENSRVNRGLVSVSASDEISTSILSSNSCSNTNNLMKSTVSDQIINNPTRPLSLNSLGTVFSSNPYAIFSPNERSLEDFSSVNGLNTTHLMSGSGYMSATALLQKATEMGSKVGGNSNSISPIFPRGFAGYTPIMRSFGLTQEVPSDSSFRCFDASTGSSANRNVGAVSANNGLYIDQNGFEKNMQGVNSDLSPGSTVLQSEFLDHSLLIQTENQNSANFMGGLFMELQKSVHQGIAEGEGGEKMTVDFLGLGPISRLDVMERPMWNF